MARRPYILTVVGARPQFIKAAAVVRALQGPFQGRARHRLVHTGQHYDKDMSGVFFEELGLPEPDVHLGCGTGAAGARLGAMIAGIEAYALAERPDALLVFGDTDSTLAGALAAARNGIPLAHVEAGLRSWNSAMPEELNRVLTDHCSTWLFCPTRTAIENLNAEGLGSKGAQRPPGRERRVEMVGDVMYDNALWYGPKALERPPLLDGQALGAGGYVLATVHRAHNTDDPVRLNRLLRALTAMVDELGVHVVLPLHPRTRQQLESGVHQDLGRSLADPRGVHIVPPAGYLDMMALLQGARFVVTDSGGVQKEAAFFSKPVVVLRAETEWTELVASGHAVLVDDDPVAILAAARRALEHGVPPLGGLYGDGRSAEHIVHTLLTDLS
jgi:UDP-GlcNAc3NAcA epimerase